MKKTALFGGSESSDATVAKPGQAPGRHRRIFYLALVILALNLVASLADGDFSSSAPLIVWGFTAYYAWQGRTASLRSLWQAIFWFQVVMAAMLSILVVGGWAEKYVGYVPYLIALVIFSGLMFRHFNQCLKAQCVAADSNPS